MSRRLLTILFSLTLLAGTTEGAGKVTLDGVAVNRIDVAINIW